MNGTFLLKCLAALCMLGNVTASPTLTCGCSEAISALRVEFQAKHDVCVACEITTTYTGNLAVARDILTRVDRHVCCVDRRVFKKAFQKA